MDSKIIIKDILSKYGVTLEGIEERYDDELHITADTANFRNVCLELHKALRSPVMMLFARDERNASGKFAVTCVFMCAKYRKWIFVTVKIDQDSYKGDITFAGPTAELGISF